jgi:hypothetical protein
LRGKIKRSVQRALTLADDQDRRYFEPILVGVMHGDSIGTIAKRIGYTREHVQRTWWPEAAHAVTTVFLRTQLREAGGAGGTH